MAAVDFAGDSLSPYTQDHFWPLLQESSHSVTDIPHPHSENRTLRGTAWGGNLSLLAHLVGTPYLPHIEAGILFIEDVNEEPYRVERMLLQLEHAGVLRRQQAVVLGQMNRCDPSAGAHTPYSMEDVVGALRDRLPIPVLCNGPFGHVRDKITIPLGGQVTVSIASDRYSLMFSEYNA
jgi:muramoyltetrapeptide carboxypeptidase